MLYLLWYFFIRSEPSEFRVAKIGGNHFSSETAGSKNLNITPLAFKTGITG